MKARAGRQADVRKQLGFTLLEVLIGTTLLAVMMLLLTSSLRLGAESWDAGEERMARANRLFIVENFLRGHIGGLLPVSGMMRNGRLEHAFQGGRDSLSYVALMPEQVDRSGMYRFELYVAGEGEHKDLKLRIRPYANTPGARDGEDIIDDLALLENIESFELSYLSRSVQFQNQPAAANPPIQTGPDSLWQDRWENNQLPTLIRIEIVPKGEEPWPTLIIAPRTLMLR